jgi:hypothetical protein
MPIEELIARGRLAAPSLLQQALGFRRVRNVRVHAFSLGSQLPG